MKSILLLSTILVYFSNVLSAQDRTLYYDLENAFVNRNKVKEIILWDYSSYILPDSIDLFVNLERLTINSAYFDELPESIGNLTQLKFLDLEDNGLSSLPPTICMLTNLEELNVSSNDLIELPYCIGNLKNLKKVDFSYNNIDFEAIPNSFWTLQQLESVDFRRTGLTSLPEEFSFKKSLKLLVLSRGTKELKKQVRKLKKQYPLLKVKWRG